MVAWVPTVCALFVFLALHVAWDVLHAVCESVAKLGICCSFIATMKSILECALTMMIGTGTGWGGSLQTTAD